MLNESDKAINELLEGISYLIDKALSKRGTQIYTGRLISQVDNSTWNVMYNGREYPVKYYGKDTLTENQIVKIFVPQGNQSIAFFM